MCECISSSDSTKCEFPAHSLPARVLSRVVVPHPDALQLPQGEGGGQQEGVYCTPLKHWFVRVSEVMGLTLPLCAQQSHSYLERGNRLPRGSWRSCGTLWCCVVDVVVVVGAGL